MPPSVGSQARVAVDADATFDASSERLEILSESLRKTQEILDTNGIRGTREHNVARTRFGLHRAAGDLVWHPSPLDLDRWLPRILGASEVADVFDLAETLPEFWVKIDRKAMVYRYDSCKVARATFRGSPGNFIELNVGVVGKAETESSWDGTIPALGTAANDAPYVFSDTTTLTLQGSNRAANLIDFELVIENGLEPRWTNATTATDLLETDLSVTLNCNVVFSASSPDTTDLYSQAIGGAAGTLTIVNGNMSTIFAFGVLQAEDSSPIVGSKGEIILPLRMTARRSGSNPVIRVTNDSTA